MIQISEMSDAVAWVLSLTTPSLRALTVVPNGP